MRKQNKLEIIPLGGLGEVGKNMTVIRYGSDIVVLDCGLAFPDDDMLGIDLVIPDMTYLVENQDKIRAVVITHGHDVYVPLDPPHRLPIPIVKANDRIGTPYIP